MGVRPGHAAQLKKAGQLLAAIANSSVVELKLISGCILDWFLIIHSNVNCLCKANIAVGCVVLSSYYGRTALLSPIASVLLELPTMRQPSKHHIFVRQ